MQTTKTTAAATPMSVERLEGRELMSVSLASFSTSYAISTTPTVGTTVALNPQPLPPRMFSFSYFR